MKRTYQIPRQIPLILSCSIPCNILGVPCEKQLPVLYTSSSKIFLCSVNIFLIMLLPFRVITEKNRFLLETSHTHTQTHKSFVSGSCHPSNMLLSKPNQISGESDAWKCQEFCFGFHTNPKLLTSLCMLVYQGTSFTVLSRMICMYQVSTILFSHINCLEDPLPNYQCDLHIKYDRNSKTVCISQ